MSEENVRQVIQMETVEVVIKIPKEYYKQLQRISKKPLEKKYTLDDNERAIIDGTVLPKGHGRIIDESRINKCEQAGLIMKNGDIVRCLVTDAPTIIEKARDKE